MVHARNNKRDVSVKPNERRKKLSLLQMQKEKVIKYRQIWQVSQKYKEVPFVLIFFPSLLILFPFARCHICWCMQTCNVYMDSTIIFYFLFCHDSSITWQAIFNQGESHQRTQHTEDVVGLQAWADGRIETNVAQKNIHTLFFLVVLNPSQIVRRLTFLTPSLTTRLI